VGNVSRRELASERRLEVARRRLREIPADELAWDGDKWIDASGEAFELVPSPFSQHDEPPSDRGREVDRLLDRLLGHQRGYDQASRVCAARACGLGGARRSPPGGQPPSDRRNARRARKAALSPKTAPSPTSLQGRSLSGLPKGLSKALRSPEESCCESRQPTGGATSCTRLRRACAGALGRTAGRAPTHLSPFS
jgi:hypothetical protein